MTDGSAVSVRGTQPAEADWLAPTRLAPDAVRLYAIAARERSLCLRDLARLGLDIETAEATVEELEAMRLLRRDPDNPERFSAVSPMLAAQQVLAPMERVVTQGHEQVERLRLAFESLVPHYAEGTEHRKQAGIVEMIPDLCDVRAVLDDLALDCRSELLVARPGGARDVETLEDAWRRDESVLRRGVEIRTIYQHAARYSQQTIAYVERMTELDAQVRTLADGFNRMLIFDRKIGVIDACDTAQAALLVYEPNLVDFMVADFEHAWSGADPFPTDFKRDWAKKISDELKQSIIAMLAQGLDDKAMARRLGVSERTCQRHVAQIMETLGARSRFQAGYLLGCDRIAKPRTA
jgi:hypothetical protein